MLSLKVITFIALLWSLSLTAASRILYGSARPSQQAAYLYILKQIEQSDSLNETFVDHDTSLEWHRRSQEDFSDVAAIPKFQSQDIVFLGLYSSVTRQLLLQLNKVEINKNLLLPTYIIDLEITEEFQMAASENSSDLSLILKAFENKKIKMHIISHSKYVYHYLNNNTHNHKKIHLIPHSQSMLAVQKKSFHILKNYFQKDRVYILLIGGSDYTEAQVFERRVLQFLLEHSNMPNIELIYAAHPNFSSNVIPIFFDLRKNRDLIASLNKQHFKYKGSYYRRILSQEIDMNLDSVELLLWSDLILANASTLANVAQNLNLNVIKTRLDDISEDQFLQLMESVYDLSKTRLSSHTKLRYVAEGKKKYVDVLEPILQQKNAQYFLRQSWQSLRRSCSQFFNLKKR